MRGRQRERACVKEASKGLSLLRPQTGEQYQSGCRLQGECGGKVRSPFRCLVSKQPVGSLDEYTSNSVQKLLVIFIISF